jgi:hypothetical protein
VIYQVGNETFDCNGKVTPVWELGLVRIARDQLSKNGFGLRLFGTNSHLSSIEDHYEMDFVNRHDQSVQSKHSKPYMVNEYNEDFIVNLGANGFAQYLRDAYNKGTYFHLWRGALNNSQWNSYLLKLKEFQTSIGN